MNISRTSARLLLLFSILLTPALSRAGVLECKVVEITSGDTLSVINGSGPMRVKLKAIDAPELNQPWGEMARQHLTDLVLGKVVKIELTGIGQGTNFVGLVYLDKTDIGQQMIRDGVAWYDASNDNGLGDLERRLYVESEQAARKERRGIWQDAAPVAPWEFREAQAKQTANVGALAQNSSTKTTSPAAGRSQQSSKPRPSTANWQRFAPEGAGFSVLFPPVPVDSPEQLRKAGFTYYQARSEGLIYDVLKRVNPDDVDPEEIFSNFILLQDFVHRASRQNGVSADIYPQRDLPPLNGFKGKQYEIFIDSIHGIIRVYVSRRYTYIWGVMGGYEGDPRVEQFLASFKISQGTNGAAKTRQTVK